MVAREAGEGHYLAELLTHGHTIALQLDLMIQLRLNSLGLMV